jgi:exopolyphosphatase/guanosine-5'-triphosphate,3'-diphosphate pyrophosphatase
VELIAQVARYHRKSVPKAKHEPFAALTSVDQRLVRTLAGLLRVAIALDRTHDKLVTGLTTDCSPSGVVVHLVVGSDPSLELYTAEERKGLLEAALKTEVSFDVAARA